MEPFKEFMKRRHICSVPGCRNKDCYKIARTSGGNAVLFLCPDCAGQAFAGMLGADLTDCRGQDQRVAAITRVYAGRTEAKRQQKAKSAEIK